mgnify:CR=1 FL=1|jgi:hypothetical protein
MGRGGRLIMPRREETQFRPTSKAYRRATKETVSGSFVRVKRDIA